MLLVTGATGNVGRELVAQLDAAGTPFRAMIRDEARAAALLPERVQRVVAAGPHMVDRAQQVS